MEIQSAGNSRSSILSATDVLWGFFYKEMIACNPGADDELLRYLFILKSLNLITEPRIWVKASITQARAPHKTVVKITTCR